MSPRHRLSAVVIAALAALQPAGTANGSGFVSLGPDGGSVRGFAQSRSDPSRMYCLPYRQGVFRSDDGGDSWSRVDRDLPVEAGGLSRVAISPINPDLVLIGSVTEGAILRTTDGGESWAHIVLGPPSLFQCIAFSPADPAVVLASLTAEVWRSTDAGITWSPSSAGIPAPDGRDIAWHPTTSGEALIANLGEVYRTTDHGSHWVPVIESATGTRSISICESQPMRVWLHDVEYGAHRSDDGGLTFQPVATPVPAGFTHHVEFVTASPTDPDVVIAARASNVVFAQSLTDCYRSTDGGQSWVGSEPLPGAGSQGSDHAIAMAFDPIHPDRIHFAIASSISPFLVDGIVRSDDGGLSFATKMNGIRGVPVAFLERGSTGILWARRPGQKGLWRAAAIGSPWIRTGDPASLTYGAYAPGAVHVNGAGQWHEIGSSSSMDTHDPHHLRTTDGGTTWEAGNVEQTSIWVDPLAVASSPLDGARIYAWFDSDTPELHRCDSGLDPWPTFLEPIPAFQAAAAVVDPTDDLQLFAVDGETGLVHWSSDGGISWVPRSAGLPTESAIELFQDPAQPARLAVVYETAGVYRSNDGGVSWTSVPNGIAGVPLVAADWDPIHDRIVLATKSLGAYVPGIGLVSAGLPTRRITDIVQDPTTGMVLVGTEFNGVWGMHPGSSTSTPSPDRGVGEIGLSAWPNPSRNAFTFGIRVPRGTRIELVIHDVAGRRVASPHPTEGRALWDGTNRDGGRVAAGVYFARLRAGEEQVTRRIVLLDR